MARIDPEAKAEYQAEYQAKNRTKLNAYMREWHRTHPGYNKNQMLKKLYGITLDQFNEMVTAQGGRCAVCGIDPTRLVVDHNHETGKVRGLLCDSCNNGLGRFRDDPDALMAAAAYLIEHGTVT